MVCNLPPDLLVEILNKLPVRSIVTCSRVCKSWHNLIKDPYFITNHLSIKNNNNNCDNNQLVLVSFVSEGRLSLSLYVDKGEELEEYMKLNPPNFKRPDMCRMVSGSCNGLVCFVDVDESFVKVDADGEFILWNPVIEKVLNVPMSQAFRSAILRSRAKVGFGFDYSQNDFKVLTVFPYDVLTTFPSGVLYSDVHYVILFKAQLFSLRQGYWRDIDSDLPNLVGRESFTFVNGFMNCIGYRKIDGNTFHNVIVEFDVSTEKFCEIMLPPVLQDVNPFHLRIMVYKDSSIAILNKSFQCGVYYELWVMREYGVEESWTELNIAVEAPVILGFNNNGEVILKNYGGYVFSFDPKSKHQKNYEIRGKRNYLFVGSYLESLVLFDHENTRDSENHATELEEKEKKQPK